MRLIYLVVIFMSFAGNAQERYLFIGTYTGGGSKGIYVYKFNTETGSATWVSNTEAAFAADPGYLDVAPSGKYVYAVVEEAPGFVAAFSFDTALGQLHFINKESSAGGLPSYVAVTPDNKWVAAANYKTGSVVVYGVNGDGSLKKEAQVVQHQGRSVLPRQAGPHAHSAVFSPDGKYLLVPDLGLDKIMIYPFNGAASSRPLGRASYVTSRAGTGPRHLVFHPNGKWAYNLEEISGTVSVYNYLPGKLEFAQRIAAHPDFYRGDIGSADIHLSPDGRFLYCSNRGDENTITIFAVDMLTGKLATIGYQSTMGKKPRNFMIDPTGNFLLVANQDSDNVIVFKRNVSTGLLTPTGTELSISRPACLKMW
jgi:6-phosphogluconolactonase